MHRTETQMNTMKLKALMSGEDLDEANKPLKETKKKADGQSVFAL